MISGFTGFSVSPVKRVSVGIQASHGPVQKAKQGRHKERVEGLQPAMLPRCGILDIKEDKELCRWRALLDKTGFKSPC